MPTSPGPPSRGASRRLGGRLRLLVRGRWARAGRVALPAIVAAYLALLAFPEVLFAHQVSRGRFRVYSDEPIDARIGAVLDEATTLLAKSPLDDPAMVHRLFVCNGPFRGRLLAPRRRGSFGTTYTTWLRGNTILNRADVASDVVFRQSPRHNRRRLSRVIAHERVHALMERRYGTLACRRLPEWKREGYCEYVAGGPSLDVEEGRRRIREGTVDGSGPFRYFRSYAMTKYLLDVEGLGIDEVIARPFDEAELMAKVRQSIDRLRL